jgi:hypothetical protein
VTNNTSHSRGSRATPKAARPSGRRRWFVGLAIALVAIAGAALRTSPRRPAAAEPTPVAAEAPTEPAVPPSTPSEPRPVPTPPSLPPASAEATKPVPDKGDEGPGPYLLRYDGRSGRMSRTARPLGGDTTKISSQGGDPVLTVWADSMRIPSNGSAMLHATLVTRGGELIFPDRISVHVSRTDALTEGFEREMLPSSTVGSTRFDAEFKATGNFAPHAHPDGKRDPPVGINYVVTAEGTWNDQPYKRRAANLIFCHEPGAALAADSAHVTNHDGNLMLNFRTDVTRAGNYWAYAELWGGPDGDRPVAFARQQVPGLSAGPHDIELMFGGQIIADSGVDGPYTIRNAHIDDVGTIPPHQAEPVAVLASTPAYHSTDFH